MTDLGELLVSVRIKLSENVLSRNPLRNRTDWYVKHALPAQLDRELFIRLSNQIGNSTATGILDGNRLL